MAADILIIDDERNFREFLAEALEAEGFAVRIGSDARSGLALAAQRMPDVVLLDQNLPDRPGVEVLKELRMGRKAPAVVVVTAHAAYGAAVRAIKAGASQYLVKPFEFSDLLECLAEVSAGAAMSHLEDREMPGIVGESPSLAAVKERVLRIARAPVSRVLLYGESGTGKEVIARAIHDLSARASSPFISVNCAALTDSLLMSELFGHERGAFTDARERRIGLFEAAAGGTLLLDEVTEMGPQAQAALLRVLEQRAVRRVGGTSEIPVDVRIIAATNRSLEEAVGQGRFRADIFYRLSIVQLRLPPLRERGDDIIRLAEHFCEMLAPGYGVPVPAIPDGVRQILRSHAWPGNVRELRNAIEHALVGGAGSMLRPDDLPAHVRLGRELGPEVAGHESLDDLSFPEAKQRVIADFERRYLTRALRRSRGNVSRAAEEIGILRQALQRLLSRHGVDVSNYR